MRQHHYQAVVLGLLSSFTASATVAAAAAQDGVSDSWDYSGVLGPSRETSISFSDLPGFSRSVYARDHALICPESRVWATQPGWQNALTAHLISPGVGASFAMSLADMKAQSLAGQPPAGAERFAFVLDGSVNASAAGEAPVELHADGFYYFPPAEGRQHSDGCQLCSLTSEAGAGLLLFERMYAIEGSKGKPQAVSGNTAEQPVLPVPGEVFALRKLMPPQPQYDFNIHVMDFQPGESLYVKELHYNQHGLLLLQGQGIYRLADSWYPVQAGDAIWMPPFVIQWYAALGKQPSRYILYKDTIVDPLLS